MLMEPRVPPAPGSTRSDSAWKSIQSAAPNLYFVISEGSALINLPSQESQGGASPVEVPTVALSGDMEGGIELEIIAQSPKRPGDLPGSALI